MDVDHVGTGVAAWWDVLLGVDWVGVWGVGWGLGLLGEVSALVYAEIGLAGG